MKVNVNEEVGKKYGYLTVIKYLYISKGSNRKSHYLCKCDCGYETVVPIHHLRNGNTKSCGCKFNNIKFKNNDRIIGQKYGTWTVLEAIGRNKYSKLWKCKCDCGDEYIFPSASLLQHPTCLCNNEQYLPYKFVSCHLYDDNTYLFKCSICGFQYRFTRKEARLASEYIACEKCLQRDIYPKKSGNVIGNQYGPYKVIGYQSKDNKWKCYCSDCNEIHIFNKSSLIQRNKHSECYYGKKGIVAEIYRETKRSANNRGLCFDLSKDDIRNIIFKDCYYCGTMPYNNGAIKRNNILYNGIDRIDNDKGYVKDNCITACYYCNFAKRNMKQKDFISWLDRIALYRNKK